MWACEKGEKVDFEIVSEMYNTEDGARRVVSRMKLPGKKAGWIYKVMSFDSLRGWTESATFVPE